MIRAIGWTLAGVLSLVVTLVAVALIVVHTDYGRNKLRVEIEAKLDDALVGGAKIGRIDGSVFGELRVSNVQIFAADGTVAVAVPVLKLRVGLASLLSKDVDITELEVDDADVDVTKLAGLAKPAPADAGSAAEPSQPPDWTIDVPALVVRGGHVHVDADTDLDGVTIDARAHVPLAGDKSAAATVAATWRQRFAPIAAVAQVSMGSDDSGATVLAVPSLEAHAGDVVAAIAGARVVLRGGGELPVVQGRVAVNAPKDAVAALIPQLVLPGDASLVVEAGSGAPASATPVTITAKLGEAQFGGSVIADLDKQAARGELALRATGSGGEVDVAALTHGGVAATAAATIRFDVAKGAAGGLPVGHLDLAATGRFGTIPHAQVTAKLASTGDRVTAKIDVTGPATASVDASVVKHGDTITLESARVVASTEDPHRSSGGAAPVSGQLRVDLAARGALAPKPNVDVHGTVTGGRIAAAGVSVRQLSVAIDATSLPSRPVGHATVHATDLERGDVKFGELVVDAASRRDGKVAVSITSHPGFAAWAVELAALVTPPADTGTTTVEIERHHVRAGAQGGDWSGEGGTIVIAPDKIAVTGLHTASERGRVAVDATMQRTGRAAGDLAASVDLVGVQLAALHAGYAGAVDAHVRVARRGAAWSGNVDVAATGVALGAGASPIDSTAKLAAGPGAIAVDSTVTFVGPPPASARAVAIAAGGGPMTTVGAGAAAHAPATGGATSTATEMSGNDPGARMSGTASGREKHVDTTPKLPPVDTGPGGSVHLAVSVAAPQRLDDVAAWRRLGREAITSLTLRFDHVDLARVVALAPPPAPSPSAGQTVAGPSAAAAPLALAGRLDGELAITPTGITGALRATQLRTPALRGIPYAEAALAIAQPTPDELDPTIVVSAKGVGSAVAVARLAIPAHPFAPGALSLAALRGATVETGTITVDPAMLDRLGVTSTARGTLQVHVDVADQLRSAKVVAHIRDLRGVPIAKPVDIDVTAGVDDTAATAQVAMTADRTTHVLELDAKLPLSLAALRADPARARTAPLTATLTLPETSAPRLLDVFGKTEVTGGTIAGTVEVTGTIAAPHVAAKLTGRDLAIPPGPNGKPVDTVHRVAIDATWDAAHGGKVSVDAAGAKDGTLAVRAAFDTAHLDAATARITAAHFDLAPLLAFAPGPAGGAKGTLDAKLAVTGFDPRTAKITGDLHLRGARLPIAPTVGTLRDASVDIAIHEHDIGLAATGKLGGGTLAMNGSIALDGASLTGGKAKLTLRKVSPIGSVQPAIDADVSATLARTGTQWRADVTVDHGFVKIGSTTGEKLKPVGLPDDLVVGAHADGTPVTAPTSHEVAAAPKNPIFVAHIVLHDTNVESEQFRTTLKGDLTMTADASAIGMTGGIEAMGGNVDLFDRRYRVERAAVRFDGTIDPQLDVLISYDFPDVTTDTQVRGRLSKPQLELSSNPGLYSKSQLLGFLLGGEPGGDPNSGGARDKAEQAGESFVANQIGSYVKSALPIDIDVIKYEAASVSSSAAITVGSWITHTLFFSFRQHLDARPDENSDEGTLEWWLTHRLEVEATAGDRNFDGVDMLWRRRF
nr:translocation/assembly module TamB domain-containing protein [Kofleriaceae bacterium]